MARALASGGWDEAGLSYPSPFANKECSRWIAEQARETTALPESAGVRVEGGDGRPGHSEAPVHHPSVYSLDGFVERKPRIPGGTV